MKRYIWVSGILFLLLGSLEAQESKEAFEKVAPVYRELTSLHERLSVQRSLSLAAVATGHVEPGFAPAEAAGFTGTFKLFYKGDRFLYDVEFTGPKGPTYSQVEYFDGRNYGHLNRIGGRLSRSAKPFLYDVVMSQGHIFFMPFTFLQSGFRSEAFLQLSYERLTKKDDWIDARRLLSEKSKIEEVAMDNEPCLKLTNIGVNIDPVSELPCTFDVYFAKSLNWYPKRWERRLSTGVMVTSYSVEEVGFIKTMDGTDIPYPKVSILNHYREDKLRDTERLEVKQINFDTVTDEDLTIDPATANHILDLDKR